MSESADTPPGRPRPAPVPLVPATFEPVDQPTDEPASADVRPARFVPIEPSRRRRGRPRLERPQGVQVVAAAGEVVFSAARVGRLLGRSGWRAARQLPMVDAVEQQAHRLRHAAAAEMLKLLEIPPGFVGPSPGSEEHRLVQLVQNAGGDVEPLRTAMTELLDRSTDPDRTRSRDYLFGTIVSQLVPDEARILAQLAAGGRYAVVDVVAKHLGRSPSRTVLANVSTVGVAAGISAPVNTPTYVGRLHGFGLVDIELAGDDADRLADQFDRLDTDPDVRRARTGIDRSRGGSAKLVRRTLRLSALGREFWTACAPTGVDLARRSG